MYVCRREAERSEEEKKERRETEWRHRINLPGRKLPHKYNREGKASWWSAGIARRTVTDSAHRTGRGNLRGVGWDGWTCQRQSGGCAEWKGGDGGRLLYLSLSLYVAQYTAAWNMEKRHEWSMGFCAVAGTAWVHTPTILVRQWETNPPLGHWQARYAAWWARRTWSCEKLWARARRWRAASLAPTTPSRDRLANIVDVKNRMIENPISRQKRKML